MNRGHSKLNLIDLMGSRNIITPYTFASLIPKLFNTCRNLKTIKLGPLIKRELVHDWYLLASIQDALTFKESWNGQICADRYFEIRSIHIIEMIGVLKNRANLLDPINHFKTLFDLA